MDLNILILIILIVGMGAAWWYLFRDTGCGDDCTTDPPAGDAALDPEECTDSPDGTSTCPPCTDSPDGTSTCEPR